jgi:hypothetical protein
MLLLLFFLVWLCVRVCVCGIDETVELGIVLIYRGVMNWGGGREEMESM